jgi:peptidoglycan-N-acetylglucosamine deacetylase
MLRWPHGVLGALGGWFWGDVALGRVPGWPEAVGAGVGIGLLGLATVNVRSQSFARAVCHGPRGGDAVALTFDDGPDPETTPAVLDTLARHNAPAAFFCIGAKVQREPALARRIVDAGHEVHSHGFVHDWPTYTYVRGVLGSIERADAVIADATGAPPAYFRPPYGLTFPAVGVALQRKPRPLVGWSLRSHDTGGRAPGVVLRRALDRVRGGDIILLHDAAERAGGRVPHGPAILDALLAGLAAKGLRPVALRRLVG